MRKAFRHDPAPIEIHQMSSLGIVQISRARRGAPLAARFQAQPASAAAAAGTEPSARVSAERLLAALQGSRRLIGSDQAGVGLKSYLAGSAGWQHAVQRIGYRPELIADDRARGRLLRARGGAPWPVTRTRMAPVRWPPARSCGRAAELTVPAVLLRALPRPGSAQLAGRALRRAGGRGRRGRRTAEAIRAAETSWRWPRNGAAAARWRRAS